jgi:hypothetical protein
MEKQSYFISHNLLAQVLFFTPTAQMEFTNQTAKHTKTRRSKAFRANYS